MVSERNVKPNESVAVGERERLIAEIDGWLKAWGIAGADSVASDLLRRCRAALEASHAPVPREIRGARRLVDEQALDEGRWFHAETAAEAYVQQALRALHAAVETSVPPREPTREMCLAGWNAAFGKYSDDSKRNVTVIWQAMWDAGITPPEPVKP